MSVQTFITTPATEGAVLASLRKHVGNLPWSLAKKHLANRLISVNGILCVDEGRRVVAGDVIEVRQPNQPLPPPPRDEDVRILFLDQHIVVADKPSGMLSLRHPGDVNWKQRKKDVQPSLEECLLRLIARRREIHIRNASSELLAVHRIDRETSGILVFARNALAQNGLIEQFAAHSSVRRYLCIIPGFLQAQKIESWQIRDRGDGLRGGTASSAVGKQMVTHISPVRRMGKFTELECRLETGRTNQIRIQLTELGHPLCGDVKYRGSFGKTPIPDLSAAPRLALHAAELGFLHPITGEAHEYKSGWPKDMLSLHRKLKGNV